MSSVRQLGGLIKRASANTQCIEIRFTGKERIVVDGQRRLYWPINQSDLFFSKPPKSHVEVKILPCSGLSQMNTSIARRLSEFEWQLAYSLFGSTAIPTVNDVLYLDVWPNLTRLPCKESFYAIAALLSTRPTSPEMIHRITGALREDCYQFCHAAKESGYLRSVGRSEDREQLPPCNNSSIIKALLVRLRS